MSRHATARDEAIQLIATRVADRDTAARDDRADPEPFAQALLAELGARGWRYVDALRPPDPTDTAPLTPAQRQAWVAYTRRQITHREQP